MAGLDHADERVDRIVRGDRRRRRQRAHQLDRVARQADLLLGLAEGRVTEVLLLFLDVLAATRERDLTSMSAQVLPATREHSVQLAVLDVEGNEHGGVDTAVNVEPRSVLRRQQQGTQRVAERAHARPAAAYTSFSIGTATMLPHSVHEPS